MGQTHRHPFTVFYRRGHLLVLSILIVLVAGFSALTNLPRLEDPRIDLRNVLVITPYPGASAERVEALVTDVLEDSLRELFEIKQIKSTSRSEISIVSIELQDWIDNSSNEQVFSEIRDTIAQAAARFPAGAGTPQLDDKRGATAFTLIVGLQPSAESSSSLPMVSRLATELSDRWRNVAGTELIRRYGDVEEQVLVTLDPQQLALAGLTMAQVSAQIRAADPRLPSGNITGAAHQLRIRLTGTLERLEDVAAVPIITAQGSSLLLSDVASIERTYRTPVKAVGLADGTQTVFVAARMQTNVRADQWTAASKQVIEAFEAEFRGTVATEIVFEQNRYTDTRLSELSQNLILGSAVVMLVILFFMGGKAAGIVGLALPLCAAFAVFSLSFFDEQIHQMSIFGIIIAIGLLIDNAIVITDEIRLNLQHDSLSRVEVMAKSVNHLFVPLLASTLTTILGFMPIFLLNGNIGDFISPIAISVVMALLGSLFISLTLIAALAARYLPRSAEQKSSWYRRGIQWPGISHSFSQWVLWGIRHPQVVIPVVMIFSLSGLVLVKQLPNVFFPSADRDQFEIYVWNRDGAGIESTERLVRTIDTHVRGHEAITQVTWLIGGSAPSVYYNQVMLRDNMPNFANAVITAESAHSAQRLIDELQTELSVDFPQVQIVVRAFGQGPPIAAPIEVDVFGPDLAVLNTLGQSVRLALSEIAGVTQSTASITMAEPELTVAADPNQLAQIGMTQQDVASQLQQQLVGQTGGMLLESTESMPVRVRVGESLRSAQNSLASMPIVTSSADVLPLAAVSDIALQPSVTSITREDGIRLNRIQAYLRPGVAAIDVSQALRESLEGSLELPPGYRFKMAGDADEQQQALGQLATYLPVLLVLMITTLILSFHSVRMASVIGVVAFFAVGLGMFSLWLSGLPLGFNPLLGSAGLIGVAINGSIVVIAAIQANPAARRGDAAAILAETMSCSRHILSTTFTTVGGLIPLLLFSEGTFWPPLAVVLAGGVGFSVILSLFFTPTIVGWLYRRRCASIDETVELDKLAPTTI